ncbi:MAG: hypothetical protein PF483_10820, partial [Halothiobacillus sp.]|nr:hypothetical protein [Halothiobacillus sp.]
GRSKDFVQGSTVIYLARHSVELFLKGALLKARVNVAKVHSLAHLADEYERAYTNPNCSWDIPFRTQVIGGDGEEEKRIIKQHDRKMPGDQVHRYPADKHFQPWEGVSAFDADHFTITLNMIRGDFNRLAGIIYA